MNLTPPPVYNDPLFAYSGWMELGMAVTLFVVFAISWAWAARGGPERKP